MKSSISGLRVSVMAVLALHLADEPMTDIFVPDEALDRQLVGALRRRCELCKVR